MAVDVVGPGVAWALLRAESEIGLEMLDGWRLCCVREVRLESCDTLFLLGALPSVTDGLQN